MITIFFSILPFLAQALNLKQDLGAAAKDNVWNFTNQNTSKYILNTMYLGDVKFWLLIVA
jgi:hypothetical protein